MAHQRAVSEADDCATAAGRVYEKLHEHLAPLLGVAGVRALFVRSAKLSEGKFVFPADAVAFEDSTKLRASLETLDPVLAAATAEALFATFFALITTFIGQRLTLHALRAAWPTIEGPASTETKK
ncbi:MAG: hypothetical protein ACXV5L_00565 [Thermoanaerobaculia bacterium]